MNMDGWLCEKLQFSLYNKIQFQRPQITQQISAAVLVFLTYIFLVLHINIV